MKTDCNEIFKIKFKGVWLKYVPLPNVFPKIFYDQKKKKLLKVTFKLLSYGQKKSVIFF